MTFGFPSAVCTQRRVMLALSWASVITCHMKNFHCTDVAQPASPLITVVPNHLPLSSQTSVCVTPGEPLPYLWSSSANIIQEHVSMQTPLKSNKHNIYIHTLWFYFFKKSYMQLIDSYGILKLSNEVRIKAILLTWNQEQRMCLGWLTPL